MRQARLNLSLGKVGEGRGRGGGRRRSSVAQRGLWTRGRAPERRWSSRGEQV